MEDRRSSKYPEQYIEVNIRGTTTLLAALGECSVKMVVQASTRVKDNNTYLDEKSERRPVNVNPCQSGLRCHDTLLSPFVQNERHLDPYLLRIRTTWTT